MRVWKCDRCNRIYEKNSNTLLEKLDYSMMCGCDDYSAAYIKCANNTKTIDSSWMNLCDECFLELENWLLNK